MLEPGTILANRYTIHRPLGRGGMGAVYLASMEALGGKKVAVKEMELQGHNPAELQAALKQFQTEATFLANLDHPNLVSVSDFFAEGNRYYLVMAHVDGETLDQKLRQRGQVFEWSQVREWALTLCEVLHYLHTRTPPILFRDLKPSNIMLDRNGTLKLIDFGIARLGEAGSKTSTFLQGTGTSGFSPIEQYGGSGSTDARSDVYSLGATMYILLTGQVPPDAVSRLSGKSIRPPSLLQPGLNHTVDAVVLRALAQLAKDRFQSMDEMRKALSETPAAPNVENVLPAPAPAVIPPTLTAEPVQTPAEPAKIRFETFPTQLHPKAKASTWMIALASLAAACLALGAISSLRPHSETGYKSTSQPAATAQATPSHTSQTPVAISSPALPSGFPVSSETRPKSTRLQQPHAAPDKPASKPSVAAAPKPTRVAVAPKPAAKISEEDYPKAQPRVQPTEPVRQRPRLLQRLPQERLPAPPVAAQPAAPVEGSGYPPPPFPPGPPPEGEQYGRPGPPSGVEPGMRRLPEGAGQGGIPGLNTPRRRHR